MFEKYYNLVNAIKNEKDLETRNDVLELVSSRMDSFRKYVNTVYKQTVLTPLIYMRYDGDILRDKIERLDKDRRLAHESAISSCQVLNRICEKYNVEHFCPETTDRYIVADFCSKITNEAFDIGAKRNHNINTMDEMMKFMTEHQTGEIGPKIIDETEYER